MPLKLPDLDDRRYKDLAEEGRSLIPTYAPNWTNHNPSDPGITLIELFAYLSEILLYRLNRITDANRKKFLKLIKGTAWTDADEELAGESLNQEISKAVREFRKPGRAVTSEDFENLSLEADEMVARARCVPRRNLASGDPSDATAEKPGHVSVIIVPRSEFSHVLYQDEDGSFSDYTEQAASEKGISLRLIQKADLKTHLPLDRLFLGLSEKFDEIQFRLAEKGRNYSLLFDYYNGSDWVQLTEAEHNLRDYTSNWEYDGPVRFTAPADWDKTTVNGADGYWIRISTTDAPLEVAQELQILPKMLTPDSGLLETVSQYLEPRRLLTAAVNVVGPRYIPIGVRLTLVLMPDAPEELVKSRAAEALWRFFHPQFGGSDGSGWTFGRNVYVSEVYELLDTLPGVNYVKKSIDPVTLLPLDEIYATGTDGSRIKRNAAGELVAVELLANELVDADIVPDDILTETPHTL